VHVPPLSAYSPSLHEKHLLSSFDPEGDDVPAVQFKHVDICVAPSVTEYDPAGHFIHSFSDSPTSFKYVPAGHFVHVPPLTEYSPSLHEKHLLSF
jgi:hypothetical protein